VGKKRGAVKSMVQELITLLGILFTFTTITLFSFILDKKRQGAD